MASATSYSFIPAANLQLPSQTAKAAEVVAKLSAEVACIELPISPLAGFVALCLRLAKEGNQALWNAQQAYSQQNLQYIAYCFQYLQHGQPSQLLPQLFPAYSANVTQELETMRENWQASRASPLSGTAESLTFTALASAFGVAFLVLSDENYSVTLPLFAQNIKQFQLIPLAVYGGWSLVFSGINMPDTQLLSLLREAEQAQSLLSAQPLSEVQYQTLKSLVERIETANSCELTKQLDSAAAGLWQRAIQMKSSLACSNCSNGMGVQLKCGHRCCNSCVFAGQEWVVGSQVASPCCSLPLSMAEIHTLVSDAIFNAKVKSISDFGYVLCITCGRLTESSQATALSCNHSACLICVVTAIQTNSPLCQLCSVYPDETLLNIINETPLQCSLCEKQKNLSGFPKFRCEDHTACFDCFDSTEVCPACSRPLTEEEHISISRCFFLCQSCNTLKNRKMLFKGGACGCRICMECFEEQMKAKRVITTCFLCNVRYPESTLDSHFRLFKALINDLLVPELQPIHHRRIIKEAPCCICDSRDKADKAELPCGHIMHCYCLSHRLLDFMLKGETAACPMCRIPVEVNKLQPLDMAIFPAERKCPTEKCDSKTSQVDPNSYKCDKEGTVFCVKCHEERKADHAAGPCLEKSRSNSIKILTKGVLKDCLAEVIQCPQCLLPHLKKKRNTKEFYCVVCKTVFCSSCKALFAPIREHGDLWHKRDCAITDAWKSVDAQEQLKVIEKSESCVRCREAGKRCEPPV